LIPYRQLLFYLKKRKIALQIFYTILKFIIQMSKDEVSVEIKQKSDREDNSSRYLSSKNKKSFFLIFDNCPYPIFLINKEGIIEDLNPAAVKLLKRGKNEIQHKSFEKLLKDELKNSFNEKFDTFIKKDYKNIEFNIIFKSKKTNNNVTCSALLVKDNNTNNNRIVLFAHDITKLKEAQKVAAFKSNLLTSLLDNIPDHIYFKDKKSRFIQASKSVADQFGVESVNELIGKTDFDYFTKEHADFAYHDEQEIIKTGKPIEVKVEKETHPDGRITWASTTKIPRYDEEGNIIGILGISRDVTKRKELEEKLKQKLEKLGEEVLFKSRLLTSLLNNIPDRIYVKDEKSRFITVSESLVQWLGAASAEEMIGKTDFDYFTEEHAKPAYEDEQDVMKTGKPIEGKIEKETHSDGRITWVSTTKIPRYDEEENVIGTLGISRDITDKVLAEKGLEESANKLKTIVTAVSEGLAIIDENHVILEANDFLCKLFGLKREKVINKKCHRIFPPWEESCKNCPLKKVFEKKESSPLIEKTKVLKNGTIQYFSIQCYPIPNYNEKELKGVISIRDITERKNMEKENIQNYKRKMKNLSHKLTLAEEHERKRIATDLHADIGQTLAFLQLKIGELTEKNSSPHIQKSLKEIYNLVQDAITSARSLMTQISPTILYELGFEPAVDWLAENILKNNNIEYEFNEDGKEKPLTDDISILLFQAVRELLVNIKKHSKAKKVRISIRRSKENIKIDIEDNGIGFDISALDSYCEKDIGFGLLNIRSRIDVVGGSFEIESRKKSGTKITLKAPINTSKGVSNEHKDNSS
jgi:PAS domain S-box-containing protein